MKLTLDREQSIRVHPKRHPITMEYTVGCDAEGRLTGGEGAHDRRHRGLRVGRRQGARARRGPRVRAVPRADVDVVEALAYTNNPPCGAMRGFGANQAHFAMEGCIDLLAEKVGLDGWEIRWRNAVEVGDTFATGQVLEKSVGLKKTLLGGQGRLLRGARARAARSASAAASRTPASATAPSEWGKARLVVEDDGTISLYNGYTEMGQGLLTVLMQCAVEVTGLARALFRPEGRLDLRARLRPDDGLARDALRRARGEERGGEAARRTSTPGHALEDARGASLRRRRPRSTTRPRPARRRTRSRRTPPSASRRRSASSTATAASSASSPPTTSAARSTRRCARGRSRARSTWGSATR